jgi:hypothetical protein
MDVPAELHQVFVQGDETALRHAWDWFELHSSQRMQFINYVIVWLGLISAGYAAILQSKHRVASGILAVAGLLVLAAFERLDNRTMQLVKLAETSLEELEAKLSASAGSQSLSFVRRSNVHARIFGSYTATLRGLFVVSGTALLGGAIYGFV